ncbi:unnamed protein product [Ectocarpus sp. 12 AP-2014]
MCIVLMMNKSDRGCVSVSQLSAGILWRAFGGERQTTHPFSKEKKGTADPWYRCWCMLSFTITQPAVAYFSIVAALSCVSCPNHPSCSFVMLLVDAVESRHILGQCVSAVLC